MTFRKFTPIHRFKNLRSSQVIQASHIAPPPLSPRGIKASQLPTPLRQIIHPYKISGRDWGPDIPCKYFASYCIVFPLPFRWCWSWLRDQVSWEYSWFCWFRKGGERGGCDSSEAMGITIDNGIWSSDKKTIGTFSIYIFVLLGFKNLCIDIILSIISANYPFLVFRSYWVTMLNRPLAYLSTILQPCHQISPVHIHIHDHSSLLSVLSERLTYSISLTSRRNILKLPGAEFCSSIYSMERRDLRAK